MHSGTSLHVVPTKKSINHHLTYEALSDCLCDDRNSIFVVTR